jgi:hypothetical protein
VVVPEPPATVNARTPVTVLLKVMFPLFEVRVLAPVKLTGTANINGLAPVTVMLLAT